MSCDHLKVDASEVLLNEDRVDLIPELALILLVSISISYFLLPR